MLRLTAYTFAVALTAVSMSLQGCKPENSNGENSADIQDVEQSAETAGEISTESSATQGESSELMMSTGVVIDGAKSYIVIQDASGSEREFEFPNLDYSHRDAYQIGDTMVVTYLPNPETGDSVVTLRQSNPEKSRRNNMH